MLITVKDYFRLPNRDEFDAWLEAEGLIKQHIYEMEVGEGQARIRGFAENDKGMLYLVDERGEPVAGRDLIPGEPDPVPARYERVVQLKTMPPLKR